jgi:triosephosphate isomerase (TIM)
MPRRLLIAGNWKLNLSEDEGIALVQALRGQVGTLEVAAQPEMVVCPTFLALAGVAKAARGSGIGVGGQNCHWEEKGAFTGEVSPSLLKVAGASHVILGHSERRQYFNETDATVNKRLKAVLANGLVPIVCVGETLTERDAGKLEQVLTAQVNGALSGFTAAQLTTLVVAYEPVWAIGTGRNATSAQAQEAHELIRSLLKRIDATLAENSRILYGGSVKPDNSHELLSMPDVDGALVGGASLKAADFAAIYQASMAVRAHSKKGSQC